MVELSSTSTREGTHSSASGNRFSILVAESHDWVIWLQLPEFISIALFYHLNYEFPVQFEEHLPN